ncbi:MAG: hypothetical protein HOE80_03955 [Candidatus Magasanikbacteria bacterium]|jgi:hypothetical protein|nr:hypothetical protein [Candidatus Magasanikbacteria bacterium]MBT4071847.1 hypothetical protein [Candidatus Magasanikbacteria bacterium]
MTKEELQTENLRLQEELEQLKETNKQLNSLVDALSQQQGRMAALFIGAQPTPEGIKAYYDLEVLNYSRLID